MPPNVHQSTWERIAHQYNNYHHDTSEKCLEQKAEVASNFMVPSLTQAIAFTSADSQHCNGKRWWEHIALSQNYVNDGRPNALVEAMSSILVLDQVEKNQKFLTHYNGRLSDVSLKLLEGLRRCAPKEFAARVADFNDNLFYQMQSKRGFDCYNLDDDVGLDKLQAFLQANEILGSFLSTESTLPQPPHVDYTYEVLDEHRDHNTLRIGFFPLTEDGMFLQVWPTSTNRDVLILVEGQIIFIPYGKILALPANTIHGGGFRTSSLTEGGSCGNLRFHVYLATDDATLPDHQSNKYTEPHDMSKELSQRYVDSRHMSLLMEHLFV